MGKKLTTEFVKEQFEKEGYTLLSKEYINANTSLEYICPEGDVGSIRWGDWQQGHRCSKYGGTKKLTIRFIREQFEKEGYTLLSDVYVNNKTSLGYICPKGDIGTITWGNWQQGARCLVCSGKKKPTIEFIRNEFKKEGYILLSKKYKGNKQKLDYICPKGHKRSIKWNSWQSGHRCKKCHFINLKGENNPNWNLELTKEERNNRNEKRRYISDYKEWCFAVKKIANFTCKVCGKRGVRLSSHHLYCYMSWPELRTVLENGVCLCVRCHKKFHSIYGYKNNTKEQFEEFLIRRIKCE